MQQPVATAGDAGSANGAWGEHARRVGFLRRVELFRDTPDPVLANVATALRPLSLQPGDEACRMGEPANEFFLIESGTLSVLVTAGSKDREINRMGPGEFFGELALLQSTPRTATVRALTPCKLWALSAGDLYELRSRDHSVDTALAAAAAERAGRGAGGDPATEARDLHGLLEGRKEVRIGRADDNDVVVDSPLASAHHAVIRRVRDGFEVVDLNSTNGTFVNGAQVSECALRDGDEIWVGNQRFVFGTSDIQRVVDSRGWRVDVVHVTKEVPKGPKLLQDISLTLLPGELVAVVGGSGAGKTTMLDAVAGVRAASAGRVLYNGRDRYEDHAQLRTSFGYVPQDDVLHPQLTVRRTLEYAARLRLPSDTSAADRAHAVETVIGQLGLADQAELPVMRLSGGQRKRVSIGLELLTPLKLFFLDEPTSGLDPGTEGQITDILRRLCQSGVTVMFTTHATATLEACDKVVVLARGGHLAFFGTPARALEYFEVRSFQDLYRRLNTEASPEQWGARFRKSRDYREILAAQHAVPEDEKPEPVAPVPKAAGLRRQVRQWWVLTQRTFELHAAAPSHLVPFMMQPLVLSVLLLALFPSGVFKPSVENPTAAMQLVFVVTLSAFVFGLLFGIQEIVKEFRIFRRERLVGLGVWPYLLSKVAFLWPLLVVLLAIMLVVLRVFDRLPSSLGVDLRLFGALALTSLAGLAAALLSSSWAKTPPQASQTLGLWIFPQTLFAGALFAVPAMNLTGRWVSALTAVRWSFEAGGRIVHLNRLFKFHPTPIGRSLHVQYHSSFFANEAGPYVVLAVFVVVPLVLAARVLKKRTAVEAQEGPPMRGGPPGGRPGGPPGGRPGGGPPGGRPGGPPGGRPGGGPPGPPR